MDRVEFGRVGGVGRGEEVRQAVVDDPVSFRGESREHGFSFAFLDEADSIGEEVEEAGNLETRGKEKEEGELRLMRIGWKEGAHLDGDDRGFGYGADGVGDVDVC